MDTGSAPRLQPTSRVDAGWRKALRVHRGTVDDTGVTCENGQHYGPRLRLARYRLYRRAATVRIVRSLRAASCVRRGAVAVSGVDPAARSASQRLERRGPRLANRLRSAVAKSPDRDRGWRGACYGRVWQVGRSGGAKSRLREDAADALASGWAAWHPRNHSNRRSYRSAVAAPGRGSMGPLRARAWPRSQSRSDRDPCLNRPGETPIHACRSADL